MTNSDLNILVTIGLIVLTIAILAVATVRAMRRDSRGFRSPPVSRPYDGGPGRLPNRPYREIGV